MSVVYAPIGLCKTWMHKHHNFGKGDPCLWPQPWHPRVGHLAVIPNPTDSLTHQLHWTWFHPSPSNYEVIVLGSVVGLVKLASPLTLKIRNACTTFLMSLSHLPNEFLHDKYMVQGHDQLRKYSLALSKPGELSMVSLQLACLQQVGLETFACCQWLEKWLPCLRDVNHGFPLESFIISTFVGNSSTAADLYQIGVPMWLVRNETVLPIASLGIVVATLDKDWTSKLPVHGSDLCINISDEQPLH
ncbi:hypothetical protein BDP27DRAFT_1419486 [Rhodocollybia butyracea]|uniref:Uncharacterized protein n=1 Tax=Rhodocollybia butyracea TaxID=206335 RepID=A0A9P5PX11_9AGAR|nr:hypothetical protein BDP27DRAFT_1419486 [Rhodocollybia butyracea]